MDDTLRCFLLNLKDVVSGSRVRRIFLQAYSIDLFEIYTSAIYAAAEPFGCVIMETEKNEMVFGWIGMDETSCVVCPDAFVNELKTSLWRNYEAEC